MTVCAPAAERGRMPTVKAIIRAWEHASVRPWLFDPKCCWACGSWAGKVVRAHIIPHSGGGTMEPSNFFLLCESCHRHQPDNAPREYQLAWLRTMRPWFDHVRLLTDFLMSELRTMGGGTAVNEAIRILGDGKSVASIVGEAHARKAASGGRHHGNELASGQWHMLAVIREMVQKAVGAGPAPTATHGP